MTDVQPIEELPPDSILVPVFNYVTVLSSSAKIPGFQLRMLHWIGVNQIFFFFSGPYFVFEV